MLKTGPSPITQWRKPRERLGFVRVEVQVRKAQIMMTPPRSRDSIVIGVQRVEPFRPRRVRHADRQKNIIDSARSTRSRAASS